MSRYEFNPLPSLGEPSGPPRRPARIECGTRAYYPSGATMRWLGKDGVLMRVRPLGEIEWRTELPVDENGVIGPHEIELYHGEIMRLQVTSR